MINEKRATEMAAYLLSKEKSGKMEYKKLMGLMYLSERKCMNRYYDLMSNDDFEAKEHGPVLSETYKLMEGRRRSKVKVWDDERDDYISVNVWNSKISKLDDDCLSVKERITLDNIETLAEADCEIMDEIWEEFGDFSERKLREYIRYNCPEWETTRRLNGKKYEGKESFPNQITIDTIGEQMNMTQYDIDGIKHSVESSLASQW